MSRHVGRLAGNPLSIKFKSLIDVFNQSLFSTIKVNYTQWSLRIRQIVRECDWVIYGSINGVPYKIMHVAVCLLNVIEFFTAHLLNRRRPERSAR